ncbi:hypothetical protein DPMN_156530 [Dreissena polymorpha]|uniref:Uncharacterized protein n=1 Tax=Dreissena polymorpha TaxID=45954 RepID=A0A9D4FQ08_DREPO|nr:hypothetical protein DPMN_156530 [Dreissena polymorpha]
MPLIAVVKLASYCRFIYMASAVNMMLGLTDQDILYDPLPLYHTAGGIIGMGQAFLWGTTVVIKKKFSASGFWDDCLKYNCTVSVVYSVNIFKTVCFYLYDRWLWIWFPPSNWEVVVF